MFKRILVPLDGSAHAERALPVAARLADASGGTVVLLQVVSPVTDFVSYPAVDPWLLRAPATLSWKCSGPLWRASHTWTACRTFTPKQL
jgi:nucleotide-binding universal stress UspA family protein